MTLTWSAAIACISYGFGVLKLPVVVVAPLTKANALVAVDALVAVGALALGEWPPASGGDFGRPVQPTLDGWGFMGGVVVDDHVQIEVRQRPFVDQL